MSQRELSLSLKALDLIVIIGCLWFCLYVIPFKVQGFVLYHAGDPFMPTFALLGKAFALVSALPLIAVSLQSWRIFSDIGANRSFSEKNASRLKLISLLSLCEGALFLAALFALAIMGALYAGAMATLLVVDVVCFSLAVVAATLSHLTRKAAQIQDENDLTV